MDYDQGSEGSGSPEVLPQEQITMLLNRQDFEEKVLQDVANLCCVMVTSTLCSHCGIRRIPYPKVPRPTNGGNKDEGEGGEDTGEAEEEEEEMGSQTEDDPTRGRDAAGHFYRDFQRRLVQDHETAPQRRHVRFFHVCACTEPETCVDFLIAKDPAYSVLNKKPSEEEIAQLRKKAYQQLKELLSLLDVRSTPYMRFYLAGQPLRYSMMPPGSPAEPPKGITAKNDRIEGAGANWMKWLQVLQNAVAVRNAVMRTYDEEQRELERVARATARRLAREERKRRMAAGEMDEEEEGDE